MTTVSAVLADLEQAMASRSQQQRAQTISRVADMFAARASDYSEDQVGIFDVVLGRLASGVEALVRIDLSERLAKFHNAPRGVVRQLALDEIAVARPVLVQSKRLLDQDLIAVASTRGRDHMLAITERPALAEPVTDFLVVKGDRVVSHALAANPGARFSARGMGLLVTRAITDDALLSSLGERQDVPQELVDGLTNAVRDSARRRLMSRAAPGILSAAALSGQMAAKIRSSDPEPSTEEIRRALAADAGAGRVDEASLASYAQQMKLQETVFALSALAKLSPAGAEAALTGGDKDALLVIGRAAGWAWPTVRALLAFRPEAERLPHLLNRAQANFEGLSPSTAQRVLQFMRVKDQAPR